MWLNKIKFLMLIKIFITFIENKDWSKTHITHVKEKLAS